MNLLATKQGRMVTPKEKHLSEPNIFVTSDLHLNHGNIISYCRRPFRTISEMNKTLVENWNNTISKRDYVFFLGDMTMGNSDKFVSHLNGNIFFIRGNHDKSKDANSMHEFLYFNYMGEKILFIHDPGDVPMNFEGWIIHGHHHNNNKNVYPFFNPEMKRINVSVELTKYYPVSMDCIMDLIKTQQKKIISL